MSKQIFDIGLIVPLKEEFQYLTEIAKVVKTHPFDGTFFYELENAHCSILACVVGEMGPLPASQATTRLLAFAEVCLIAVVGVAGGLDKDVLLADIVVADEVNEVFAKSKAIESDHGYQFKFSGRHSRIDFSLREVVNHFDISGGESLEHWQTVTGLDLSSSLDQVDQQFCSSTPKVHIGTMASGDVVGAATAFSKELLKIDRKFLAIDMEAAGVVKAATDRLRPIKVLVIRGISDFADERKKHLDNKGSGIYRKLGVRNATHLLMSLLSWSQFRDCIGLDATNDGECKNIDPSVVFNSTSTDVGMSWGVGVFFGVHSQSPVLNDTGVIAAVDINLARLKDDKLNHLIETFEETRSAVESGGISSRELSNELEVPIQQYVNSLGATEIEMLREFDKVVKIVLSEGNEDEIEGEQIAAVLAKIEHMIDEGNLVQAAHGLDGLDISNAKVRELKADVYFDSGDHQGVIDLLKLIAPEILSRREFEHLISSRYELSQFDEVNLVLSLHKDQFPDAAGQVFRRHLANGNNKVINVD